MRHRSLTTGMAALVGAACFVGSWASSQAQESPKEVRRLLIAKPAKVVFGRSKGDVSELIRAAAAVVSAAVDSDAKAAAEKNLADALDQVFEDDLKRREEELVKIEDRLKKLRALVALRREKKQEIIDLQRNVVLHEAEGLGFYDQSAESAHFKWDGFKSEDSAWNTPGNWSGGADDLPAAPPATDPTTAVTPFDGPQ